MIDENKAPVMDNEGEKQITANDYSNNSITENSLIVKCNIDKIALTKKAPHTEIGAIINRLKNKARIMELSIERLATAVTKGYSITTAEMLGTTEQFWNSQSLFIVDIDNERAGADITVEDAKEILSNHNIPYAFMYYSFSHSTEKTKFRIVTVCNEVITDPVTAKNMNLALLNLFNQSDVSCFNLDRFYYGTNKGLASEINAATFDKQILIDLYSMRVEEQIRVAPLPQTPSRPTAPVVTDFDLNNECANFNLLDYVTRTAGGATYKKGNSICVNPCPICGHKDHFNVTGGVWVCKAGNGQGNIINYLMIKDGLDKKQAVDFFKYDILGRDKEADKKAWIATLPPKLKYSQAVEKREYTDLYDAEWISPIIDEKSGEIKGYKVLPSILAEHMRNNSNYMFVRDSAKQGVQRFFYNEAQGYYKLVSDDEMKGFIKAMIPVPIQKMKDINECMQLLYTDHNYIDMDVLNADENIINFQNGTLELDTMTLREHSHKDRCTIQIACNYIADAQKPVNSSFDYFLDFFTGSDQSTQSLLLQYMGVTISNIKGWRMKKALFMVGKTDAGKSQLKALTERLIGRGNYTALDLDELEARFGTSNIFNKRLAGSSDMAFMTVPQLKVFKKATGGDALFAEYKGENGFEFTYNGVLWFCCNQLPKFGGDKGDAVFNRIMVVECHNVATKLDKQLQDKMFAERDYIVSKAVRALQVVINNDFNFIVPQKSLDAVAEYKTEVNSFLKFIEECTEPRQNDAIKDICTTKRLYDVYVAWCGDNNKGYSESKRDIKPLLDEIGKAQTKKVQGNTYYSSFTLQTSVKNDYSRVYGYESSMNGKNDPQAMFEAPTD